MSDTSSASTPATHSVPALTSEQIAQLAAKEIKKEKNKQQLAEARERLRVKKLQEIEERLTLQPTVKRAHEENKRDPDEAPAKKHKKHTAPVLSSSDSEEAEDLRKAPKVVTRVRQETLSATPVAPSFGKEVAKTLLFGGLSLAGFLLAQKFGLNATTAGTQTQTKPQPQQPAQQQQPQQTRPDFMSPTPLQFAKPDPKTPVGKSGFYASK